MRRVIRRLPFAGWSIRSMGPSTLLTEFHTPVSQLLCRSEIAKSQFLFQGQKRPAAKTGFSGPRPTRIKHGSGVVYDPFCDELWTAIRNRHSRLNGKIIQVSRRRRLDQAIVTLGLSKHPSTIKKMLRQFNQLVLRVRKLRIMGAAALDIAYVATGRFDVYMEPSLRLWDIAAAGLILESAGGEFWHETLPGIPRLSCHRHEWFLETKAAEIQLISSFKAQTPRPMFASYSFFIAILLVGLDFAGWAGTLTQFRTPLGDIDVELFDEDKPVTTENFIRYVKSGRYENTFIHRWEPEFVIQGGGFLRQIEFLPIRALSPSLVLEPSRTNTALAEL